MKNLKLFECTLCNPARNVTLTSVLCPSCCRSTIPLTRNVPIAPKIRIAPKPLLIQSCNTGTSQSSSDVTCHSSSAVVTTNTNRQSAPNGTLHIVDTSLVHELIMNKEVQTLATSKTEKHVLVKTAQCDETQNEQFTSVSGQLSDVDVKQLQDQISVTQQGSDTTSATQCESCPTSGTTNTKIDVLDTIRVKQEPESDTEVEGKESETSEPDRTVILPRNIEADMLRSTSQHMQHTATYSQPSSSSGEVTANYSVPMQYVALPTMGK